MTGRQGTAGVSLVEMLVVLVVLGTMAGAVALAITPRTPGAAPELAALGLAADLRRATQDALDHDRGFGVRAGAEGYSFWIAGADGWQAHPDPALRGVKPFPRTLRISVQDHENVVFAVSRHLVPEGGRPWQATLKQGPSAYRVIFDGITAQVDQTGGD